MVVPAAKKGAKIICSKLAKGPSLRVHQNGQLADGFKSFQAIYLSTRKFLFLEKKNFLILLKK